MRQLRLAFVVDSIGLVEFQSIPILTALARRQGHQVVLVEFGRDQRRAIRILTEYRPDIVLYTVTSNQSDLYLDFNRTLKRHLSFFSVFGGPHPTFSPLYARREGVDAVCRGEGDLCFPRFLESFGEEAMHGVDNFIFRLPDGAYRENPLGPLVEDLDSQPFPEREILYENSRFLALCPVKSFLAGRGCPYRCTYCLNRNYNAMYRGRGHVLRHKSVSYLLEEIGRVREKYPLTFVKFQDDVFGTDLPWLREFSARYPKEIGLPFICFVRSEMVSEEYADLLREAGCHSVCTAIESGNEDLRRRLLDRQITDAEIVASFGRLRRRGIRTYAPNIIGFPGETEEQIFETIRLNQRAGADHADASIFQPYPGTKLGDYCVANGYIEGQEAPVEGQHTKTVLNFPPEFKRRVHVLHKLFPILVDVPWLTRILPGLFYRTRLFDGLLTLAERFWYGFFMHRRIYASSVPFRVRLRALRWSLSSRNRNS